MPAGHHSDYDSTLLPLPKSAITWFGGIFARLPPLAAGLTNVSQPSVNAIQDNISGPDFSTSRAENQPKQNQDITCEIPIMKRSNCSDI